MNLIQRTNLSEIDYWRIRNFLREVFLLNNRVAHSWHVARLDHWRWYFIKTCELTPLFEKVTVLWETRAGEIHSAVTVLVGTAAEHWQRGLGKAVMLEGMHRLKRLGCTRVFSSATRNQLTDFMGL